MIQTRVEARIGERDHFTVIEMPEASGDTHPILVLVARMDAERQKAEHRIRIRLSRPQARALCDMLSQALTEQALSESEEACVEAIVRRIVAEHKVNEAKVGEIVEAQIADLLAQLEGRKSCDCCERSE